MNRRTVDRRTFNTLLASAAATSVVGCSTTGRGGGSGRTVLYQSVGDRLTHYDVDVESATLTQRESLTLPSVIQYAWPHPLQRYLYATTSDAPGGGGAGSGTVHRLCALRVGSDGALVMHGEPQVLSQRPLNNSVDATGAYAFSCYNVPAYATVHHINADGTIGSKIEQSEHLDFGIFAHQIRATPTNQSVVVVTRGNNATATKPEDPGALKLFRFRDGQLSPLQTIQVGGRGGLGYGPRHLDFHPSQPWVYVCLERQNQLHMHRRQGDSFVPEPDFIKPTIAVEDTGEDSRLSLGGAIHPHPDGRTVYVSNRASTTVDFNGQQVFRGGENSIAVFSINPTSGEPTAIQHADPHGYHVRAFTVDPSGRLLVAATMVDMRVRDGDVVRHVPAGLSLFRIAADGRLTFVRRYDAEVGTQQQLWVRMMALPA
jgi:6-phosphogluconolactonase